MKVAIFFSHFLIVFHLHGIILTLIRGFCCTYGGEECQEMTMCEIAAQRRKTETQRRLRK